jgi:GNAT superfamily N-acetyltransferase
MDIIFRKAQPDEMKLVLAYLRDAAIWLRAKGIDYWQNWLDPEEKYLSWIKQGFKRNEFYFVEYDGKTIGCFRLQWQDPIFWEERIDEAGYIHSFTFSRTLAGQGIGYKILSLIESHCKEKGKEFLRLDCGSEIEGLHRYYEGFGFKNTGKVKVLNEVLNLYEKKIS